MKNRDLVFGSMAKERPRARQVIIKVGLRPNPDVENWNGETALDENGREVFLTSGVRTQMRKMIREGYWGGASYFHK
jgi:hypothetical protein